jgi:hypothetical protein
MVWRPAEFLARRWKTLDEVTVAPVSRSREATVPKAQKNLVVTAKCSCELA